jgi:hypothetical protein
MQPSRHCVDSAGLVDTKIVVRSWNAKIYFWRVKAKNAIGETDWTAYYRSDRPGECG